MITDCKFLTENAKKLGVDIGNEAFLKLSEFFDDVVENNKKFNLTAITEERDFIVKHYLDSLAAAPLFKDGGKLLDIGSGAGFPAMPLAICVPVLDVCALDATQKKVAFISNEAKKLNVPNIQAFCGRAEEQTALRNKFDYVTARAVSSLRILLELAAPMLKVGGKFVAYKADDSELNDADNACKELFLEADDILRLTLPDGSSRCILSFIKTKETKPCYPRLYGAIKKKPL